MRIDLSRRCRADGAGPVGDATVPEPPSLSLSGKHVAITGGSSGIGLAVAELAAKVGVCANPQAALFWLHGC